MIAVGISHLPQNDSIFSVADIAVGIDILTETVGENTSSSSDADGLSAEHVLPAELSFVSSIAAHSCAFRFRGTTSVSHMSSILEQARGALEASVAAATFVLFGFLSFSFYVLFSVCLPSTVIPFLPTLGSVLYLQVLLPFLGFTMGLSNADRDAMKHVPPKNEQSITFARKEGWKLYTIVVLKGVAPALLPQLLHLIAFGELLLHFEPDLVSSSCPGASNWIDIVRCEAIKNYTGAAKISSGVLGLGNLALCAIISSAGFVGRLESFLDHPPWQRNHAWVVSLLVSLTLTVGYIGLSVHDGVAAALPWYYYLLAVTLPLLCLGWIEAFKRSEMKLESRAEKLRRLQFETRLGAWSPK